MNLLRGLLKALALVVVIAGAHAHAASLAGGKAAVSTFTESDVTAVNGFFGEFDLTTNAGNRGWWGDSATLSLKITGITATLRGSTTNGAGTGLAPWFVSIDGGVETQPNISVKADGVITLFSNLTDTAHVVRIRGATNYLNNNARTFTTGQLLKVWGSSPAIAALVAGGIQWHILDPSYPGTYNWLSTAAIGGSVVPAYRQPGNVTGTASNTSYRIGGSTIIRAKASSLWLFTGQTHARLSIDGAAPVLYNLSPDASANATPTTSTRMWRQIVVGGLDVTTFHTYAIAPSYDKWVNTPSAIMGVMIGGSGAAFSTKPTSKVAARFGGSFTYSAMADGTSVYGPPSVTAPPKQLTANNDVYIAGFKYGATVNTVGAAGLTTSALLTALPTLLAALPTLDVIILAVGRNDTANATLQTNYVSLINAALAASPTWVLCYGTFQGASDDQATYIAAAVAAVGDPRVVFVSTASYGISPDLSTNENYPATGPAASTHPTDVGYGTWAANEDTTYSTYLQ